MSSQSTLWKRQHKEKVAEYNKKYREKHKLEAYNYNKKWSALNKDKVSASLKKWKQKNKFKTKEYKRKYKLKHRESIVKKETERKKKRNWGIGVYNWHNEMFQYLISRDGEKCNSCGTKEKLTINHIIPQIVLGKREIKETELLEILCVGCNLKHYSSLAKKAIIHYFNCESNSEKLSVSHSRG